MIKCIITKSRKKFIYGDVIAISKTRSYSPCIGSIIEVKLFGLIWIPYKWYYKK